MAERKKERKGPSDSATAYSVGTRKKGNDGAVWTIIKTKAGVRRWKRELAAKSKSPKSQETKSQGPASHHIKFGGPMWIVPEEKAPITIGNKLYSDILKGPKRYEKAKVVPEKKGPAHKYIAYVFGKLQPLKGYKFLQYHYGPDNTGIIDADLYADTYDEKKFEEATDLTQHAALRRKSREDNKSLLKKVKALCPFVLFIGKGGKQITTLWGHTEPNGEIDSLIIDGDYFFGPEVQPRGKRVSYNPY